MDKIWFLPFVLAFAQGQFYQPGYHGNFYPYPYQPYPQMLMPQQMQFMSEQIPQQMPQQIPQQISHQETATTKQMNYKQNVDSLTKAFNQKYTNLQKQNADSKVLEQANNEYLQQYGKSKELIALKGKSSKFCIFNVFSFISRPIDQRIRRKI